MTSGENSYLADFTSNQTEADQFPFTIWAKMVREVLSDSRIQLMTNPPCGGIMSLRQSIAGYLKDFRGMTVQPEQIIIGAGTESGTRGSLCGGKSGISEDRENLSELSGKLDIHRYG